MRLTRILLLVSLVALVAVPAASALRFTDDDFDMPVGQVGAPYSKQFYGGAGCGPALPYQFRILSGFLPPGISLAKSGLFSGAPTVSGSWSFWVELSDQDPPTASWCIPKQSQREFTITVIPSTLAAEVALPFRKALPGTKWSRADGTTLPDGLALNPTTGVISGAPVTAGSSIAHVVETDAYGFKHAVDIRFTVATELSATSPSLRAAKAGKRFGARVDAEGGVTPYTWTIARGALPRGLHLDAKTGSITGTARRPETSHVTLRVKDHLGAVAATTLALRVAR